MSDKIIRIDDTDSEADTCRKEVLPKLYSSQWTDDLICIVISIVITFCAII